MTVNGICHTLWEDEHSETHVCGRTDDHDSWHLCACGAMLLTGRSHLTPEQRELRKLDCPECNARAGRPCHTMAGHVMSGVHASRAPEGDRTRTG